MPGIGVGISPVFSSYYGGSSTPASTNIEAYGGIISYSGGRKYHTFAPGAYNFGIVSNPLNVAVRYAVWSGGGSTGYGGGTAGGAGGGGRFVEDEEVLAIGNYSGTIGAGGVLVGGVGVGINGGASTFNGITCPGGGAGGGDGGPNPNGQNGYTGGGGGAYNGNTGALGGSGGIGSSGFNGGNGVAHPNASGGGAGMTGAGTNAVTTTAGNGGPGTTSDISGVLLGYCGGGGGSARNGGVAGTGQNGGGNGNVQGNSTSATSGVRGGGAGGSSDGAAAAGGDGGLIVSYSYSLTPEFTEYTLFAADDDFTRYGGWSPIQLQNGSYVMYGSRYGANPGDFDESTARFYSTTDFISPGTFLSEIGPDVTDIAISSTSAIVLANGDVYVIYLALTGVGNTSRLIGRRSTDGCLTWGAKEILRDNPGEYLNATGDRFFRTSTGRILFPFDIALSSDLTNGAYSGLTFVSDDEAVTWDDTLVSEIPGPPTHLQNVEGGYMEYNGTVTRWMRTYEGPVYKVTSVDDGETNSALSLMNIPYITRGGGSDPLPCTLTIYKMVSGRFAAVYNTPDRTVLQVAQSVDGITWDTYLDVATIVVGEQIPGAYLFQSGNYLYIYFQRSASTSTRFSQCVIKLKISTWA